MRKLLIVVALGLFAMGLCAEEAFKFGVSYDFPGPQTFKSGAVSRTYQSRYGVSFTLEYLWRLSDVYLLGGGAEWQIPRRLDDRAFEHALFDFLPLYISNHFQFASARSG